MSKITHDKALVELIKDMRDLRIEMIELKRSQKPSASNTSEGTRGYIERCMWYDSSSHKYSEYNNY